MFWLCVPLSRIGTELEPGTHHSPRTIDGRQAEVFKNNDDRSSQKVEGI